MLSPQSILHYENQRKKFLVEGQNELIILYCISKSYGVLIANSMFLLERHLSRFSSLGCLLVRQASNPQESPCLEL